MTLSNAGTEEWSGWIEANVTDMNSGEWSYMQKYIWVQLGAGSTKSYSFIAFADMTEIRDLGFWDSPNFQTTIQPAQGVIKCPFCDGTGRIDVFSW